MGGEKTITGLIFEKDTDLRTAINTLEGFSVVNNDVKYKNNKIATLCSKYDLYNIFLKSKGIDWKKEISKRLIPDEAIFVDSTNTLYIIEKKYQEVEGSVDEKLQTCDFKKWIYMRLVSSLKIKVSLIYVLNDWFKKEKYHDSLEYIKNTGCEYYFNELPLEKIGLPISR